MIVDFENKIDYPHEVESLSLKEYCGINLMLVTLPIRPQTLFIMCSLFSYWRSPMSLL